MRYSKLLAALGSTQPVPVVVTTSRCCRSNPPARSRSSTASRGLLLRVLGVGEPREDADRLDRRAVRQLADLLGTRTSADEGPPLHAQVVPVDQRLVAAGAQRRRRSFDPLRRLEVAEGERRVERAQPRVSRHPAEQCPRHEAHRHDSQDPCHRGPEPTLQQPSHPSRGGPGATRQSEEQRGDDQRHRWHEEHERDGRRLRPGQVVGLGLPPHARGEAREQGRDPSHQEDRPSQVRPRLPRSVAQPTPAPREEDPDAVPRAAAAPLTTPWASGERGSSDGVSERQAKPIANASPAGSRRERRTSSTARSSHPGTAPLS